MRVLPAILPCLWAVLPAALMAQSTAPSLLAVSRNYSAAASAPLPTATTRSNDLPIPPNMVYVEGGVYMMGASDGNKDELPEHRVEVAPFFMDKYEVTVKQFGEFVAATNYQTDADRDSGSFIWGVYGWEKKKGVNWKFNHRGFVRSAFEQEYAVLHVSWNDAMAYAKWAGKRLPTENEWEWAARGGVADIASAYAGGNDLKLYGWFDTNSSTIGSREGGKLRPNELGIYDLSGNVWEWCADVYAPYQGTPASSDRRVLRGGSWYYDAASSRVANRDFSKSDYRTFCIGFRCVKDL